MPLAPATPPRSSQIQLHGSLRVASKCSSPAQCRPQAVCHCPLNPPFNIHEGAKFLCNQASVGLGLLCLLRATKIAPQVAEPFPSVEAGCREALSPGPGFMLDSCRLSETLEEVMLWEGTVEQMLGYRPAGVSEPVPCNI